MLSPLQNKAMPHLLSGSSIREGCRKAGISLLIFLAWAQIAPAIGETGENYGRKVEGVGLNSSQS
jgi:hypothetical protein